MTTLHGAVMAGSYDPVVAVLSVLIAVLTSYIALDLAERVTAAGGASRPVWLIGGAVAMGIGIWSIHFTAMLAFRLPVPVFYHWPTVLLSVAAGIIASAIALFAVSRTRVGWQAALAGSIFQGFGIAALHYTVVAALRLQAMCHYSAAIAALSVVFAIAGSLLSLWLMFFFRHQAGGRKLRKVFSAVSMGASICGMHFTGMAAVRFTDSGAVPNLANAVRVTALDLADIVTITLMVLVGAGVTCLVDRLQERGALLDELFEQTPQATALMTVDHRVVRVNREFTRFFGYTPQEALGRRLSDLIVPGEFRDQFQSNAELVSRGQRMDTEAVRQHKDGSRRHVLALSVPVSMPSGQIAVCTMYRDITQRKAAETALQALSSRLLEVQETERRHLARELHDEIGQLLTSLRLLLRPNGDSPPDELKTRFEQARVIVDDLLAQVRSLSFELRPTDLDHLGLLPALLGLFERYTAQTGILINFMHQGVGRRFASQVETGAYRIVQEALTNSARHAGVAAVSVRVWSDAEQVNLQVEDRGCGFDPEAALKLPSSGLLGMQERILLLGGRIAIDSSPGSGTTITAELPLNRTKAA